MTDQVVAETLRWYASSARDLPWRRPGTAAWSVLVSEVMLQQTPVSRVLPAYDAWLARWPSPVSLAAAPAGDAVRQWGRLGYPRRAIRLHGAAQVITESYGGRVPSRVEELRALPGVGSYTAAAVAAFAFGQRHTVLDTNVRRVLARLLRGEERPAATPARAEVADAESLLPPEPAVAARWSVAVMELGALVCTATRPRCGDCPLTRSCAWHQAGCPASGAPRRTQRYEGTDRQCRGRLMAVLREAARPVPAADVMAAWHDAPQRERALASLVTDGLAQPLPDGRYSLPA